MGNAYKPIRARKKLKKLKKTGHTEHNLVCFKSNVQAYALGVYFMATHNHFCPNSKS